MAIQTMQPKQADPPTDHERAIRRLIDDWLRASKRGDTERVLSLMADDVVFLVAGQPPMRGKAAFAEAQKAMLGKADIDATADIQEIEVFGDHAYCWNRLTVVVTPRDGGQPVTRRGDVLSVLKKEAGGWVIVRDANLLTTVSS